MIQEHRYFILPLKKHRLRNQYCVLHSMNKVLATLKFYAFLQHNAYHGFITKLLGVLYKSQKAHLGTTSASLCSFVHCQTMNKYQFHDSDWVNFFIIQPDYVTYLCNSVYFRTQILRRFHFTFSCSKVCPSVLQV